MKARSTPKLDLSIWSEIGRVLYLPNQKNGAAAMSSTIKIKAPEPLKFSLLKAAINCEHHITGSVIRLVHDPEAPGHNALNQLGNRLDAEARDQLAARDAQWKERVQEMVGPVVEALKKVLSYPENWPASFTVHDCWKKDAAVARSALSAITEE